MIYFVQPVDGGPIKIGTTINLESRIRSLERHYGRKLAVLATMDGSYDEEKAIHDRFSHLRFGRTELFRPAFDLLEFIGRPLLACANPDTVEAIKPASALDGRDDVTTRIDRVLASRAKAVANHRGVTIGELLSELLEKPVNRAFLDVLKKIKEETEGPK